MPAEEHGPDRPAPSEQPDQPDLEQPDQYQADRLAWRSRVLPSVRRLDGGVWSIPVPIPDNPLRYTLVYALETERGPVLVDTGWDDPTGRAALADGLGAAGFTPAEVHGVLITHHHPDHHGLSAHVRERSGAWIAMHGAEAAVVRAIAGAPAARWIDRMARSMRRAGVPQEQLEALRGFGGARTEGTDSADDTDARRSGVALADALPDRELVHGESAGVPGRDVRVLWTPGHTPGMSASISTNRAAPVGCCPVTTSSPRSAPWSASTRRTRATSRPIRSATTSTPWNASPPSRRRRSCPRTSTASPTRPHASRRCSTTTRTGWPSCT